MSDTYTKLFSSITESTVWGEPYSTRIVWIAMLAMADANGDVYGAIPGLARRANVTLEETESALAAFLQPDPYSRSNDDDGRRVKVIEGGWRLINHGKYRAMRMAADRRDSKKEWDRKHRPSGHARKSDKSPTQSDRSPTKPDDSTQPDNSPTSPTDPTPPTPAPTPRKSESRARDSVQEAAKRAAAGLQAAGCTDASPSDPRLLMALEEGISSAELVGLANTKKGMGKGLGYLIQTIRGQRRDAAPVGDQSPCVPPPPVSAEAAARAHRIRELEAEIIDAKHCGTITRVITKEEMDERVTRAQDEMRRLSPDYTDSDPPRGLVLASTVHAGGAPQRPLPTAGPQIERQVGTR